MKRILLPVLFALGLAACSGDSSLPEPDGEGQVRAINAISTSPDIFFLVEERPVGSANYKQQVNPVAPLDRLDAFSYVFNFEAFLVGDTEPSRLASVPLTVADGIEYTFLVTGSLAAPTIIVAETPIREFDEGGTVFELRLAHVAEGFPTVDVYVAPEGTAPALGEQFATLAFGEVLPATDVANGDYVVTITAAGDPADVVFQSGPVSFGAGLALLVGVFAPDANDVDPLSVRGYTSTGAESIIANAATQPTVRFVNASLDLGPVDLYNDADLTSLLAANLDYQQVSAEISVPAGQNPLLVTPAGSTATVLLDSTINAAFGARSDSFLIGADGIYQATTFIPDRRSIETLARVRLFNASRNNELVDLYILEDGAELTDETLPRAIGILSGTPSSLVDVTEAGSYDVYAAPFGDRTAIAGPFDIDFALGDVVDLAVFDTVDPNVSNIVELTTP